MMKQRKIAIWAIALLGLVACSNDANEGLVGQVQLTIEQGAQIVIQTKASKSAGDVSTFGVKIDNPKGEEQKSYSSYSEVPKDLALEAGDYVMTAENDGNRKGAAFDLPYYAGSTTFSVKAGETTPVKVLCELRSSGVEVSYTKNMLATLTDISVTVSVQGGILTYTPDEKRTGWFTVPEDRTMNIAVTGLRNGDPIAETRTISNIGAKELRRIALDIKTSGSSSTQITIDTTIIQKDVTITLPDLDDVIDNNGDNGSWDETEKPGTDPDPSNPNPNPDTPKAPMIQGVSLDGAAFNIDQTQSFNAKNIKTLDVKMTATGAGGIQNLWLTIDSELLNPLLSSSFGINGALDLANPVAGSAWVEMFTELGILNAAAPIKGKTEHMFSVGGLMTMLTLVDPEGGVPHKFKLKVVDANGSTEKTLTVIHDPSK